MNALRLCLLFVCLSMILSCASAPSKPSVEPKPPRIDCSERRKTDPAPKPPATSTDWRVWASAFTSAMGWGQTGYDIAADTADCLDKYRKKGDIR